MIKVACSWAGVCVTSLALAADNTVVSSTETPPADLSIAELANIEVPVVEAASKYKQKTTEAPSSVTIITSDEIKKQGYRTLADVLASAPGFYVTYDRNYSFLGVRGFNLGDFYTRNSRVLVLVDGHRLNNGLTDGGAIGTDFILDVDLIDRVEIIRGPGSSLYGNNAFFAVINVITRKGRDMGGLGAEASGEAASFDTYKGRVTYGNRLKNGLEMLFSGTIYDSEGHDTLFYRQYATGTNNGVAHNADNDDFKSAFGSIAYQDFTLQGAFITREKRNPTAQFLTDFNDNRLRTTDERGYANLKYAHQFPGIVDVNAQLYYDRFDFNIREPYGGVLYKDSQTGEWWGLDVQFTKRLWDRHTLSVGGEYRDDFHQEETYRNTQTGDVLKSVHRDRQSHAIYIEGDFMILTNLHANLGGRYDQYGDFDPSFDPRAALIYNPINQTVFKLLYGTAFRTPNFFELTALHAPDLKPEKIATYEGVYEQGIGNHLRSSISGFYNVIDDLIQFNSAAGHQRYENLAGAKAYGTEVALEGTWANGIRGRASYTWQRTENRETGDVLTDSPEHLAKLTLSVPVYKDKIFGAVELQYVSRRTTTFLTPAGTQETGSAAAGFATVNLTLFSQNLIKGLDVSASVYNLLDKRYGDPSTPFHQQDIIQQDGRTFRVKLTYRF